MERNFQIVSFYTFSATDYEFLLRYFVALIVYTRRENHRYTLALLQQDIQIESILVLATALQTTNHYS